ncbi:hypothetical protein KR093_001868, partial [Drosophila rubida]
RNDDGGGTGGGGDGNGVADEGVAATEEMQDGDNGIELEPGELVTPPHQQQQHQQQQSNVSFALKKVLVKDAMSKSLRKNSTQIDNDNNKARSELETITRKETTTIQANGSATKESTPEADADDSEGLYSDTDSSQDGQKHDVADVQLARKEKQAEAEAAATTTPSSSASSSQSPASHHNNNNSYIGLNPLRFHMRPPQCFDFARIGFRPRMARGGLRGMRPPFFSRPPAPNRCATPTTKTSPPSATGNAYGPALPPNESKAQRSRSDLLWTSSQPPLSFIFNLVADCGNAQHTDCKPRAKETAGRAKDNEKPKQQKEQPRERSRERTQQRRRSNERIQREHKTDVIKDRHRERSKPREQRRARSKELQSRHASRQRDNYREQKRPRSTERSEHNMPKVRDRSRARSKHTDRSNERHREPERARERRNEQSNSVAKDKARERSERETRQSRSKSRKTETKPRTPPPQLQPQTLPAVVQEKQGEEEKPLQQLTPPRASTSSHVAETRKAFDIFAESPPRLNKTESPAPIVPVERSTTPPLSNLQVSKKEAAPLTPEPAKSMHSEIHSRIGALLEDNDLHLDALLATKELLRKSREQRSKKVQEVLHMKQEQLSEDLQEPASNKPRHANPFKRETVLTAGSRHGSARDRDRDRDRERDSKYKERSIKQEKQRSRTPPLLTARQIKVEHNLTPPPPAREVDWEMKPVRNGARAANAPPPQPVKPPADEHSPDTDDYIDNWENDDSMAGGVGGDSNTPQNVANAIVARLNGDDDDSNTLWNAKSTPPPKAKQQQSDGGEPAIGAADAVPEKPLFNIHELYDKFMKSIKMGNSGNEAATSDNAAVQINTTSSLSNSTAEEESSSEDGTDDDSSSSSSDSSSSASSSDDDDDDDDDDDEEDEEDDAEASSADGNDEADKQQQEQQLLSMENSEQSQSQSQSSLTTDESTPGKQPLSYKKNNVSRDLRKLQSLEDNLARIQMMRENYDSGDDICEELLKMESLFLMQRNAIMNKYRKSELKPPTAAGEEEQPQQQPQVEPKQQPVEPTPPIAIASPVNNIFNANREAIKLTISPLKLSARKPAIFDKDELEPTTQPAPPEPKVAIKPHKEIAIVKPTIMETRHAKPLTRFQQSPPHSLKRSRTRERSRERFRRYVRPSRSKDVTRSPSPRRRRPLTSPPLRRARFVKGRHSRSISRSRTRSRSPLHRRRLKPAVIRRRRSSLSPPHGKLPFAGPRSPPPPSRRRSFSRDRCYSRSPLPFKPPSPPMRRSWSSSRSRSPPRRRTRTRSPSRSRSRSRSPRCQSFADYFVENQSIEAAEYYYNMTLMQQQEAAASGEHYDGYAAYLMDPAYNMDEAYAQYSGEYSAGSTTAAVAPLNYDYNSPQVEPASAMAPVLRELPMAPMAATMNMTPIMPVAVQKGNVLEIVPSMVATVEPLAVVAPVLPELPPEDNSKPKRKRVNFVDLVLPNYESDQEDRKVVVQLLEHKVRQNQQRASAQLAREQQARDQLLALPIPPRPLAPKPPSTSKALLVQKKPVFRYYHCDVTKGLIVKSRERVYRTPVQQPPPHFDPKYMAMLVKSGRLPMPAFMRHRPPPPPAQADAMLQEFFTRHPPPPLHHVLPHYLRGPPPAMTAPAPAVVSQPIPVLGSQNYSCYPTPAPVPVPAALATPAPVPQPVPLPLPLPLPLPVPVLAAAPLTSTPPPFFTPPPLPSLSSHFKVQPVATMREIMPVDILQKIGPLPKTLDLEPG